MTSNYSNNRISIIDLIIKLIIGLTIIGILAGILGVLANNSPKDDHDEDRQEKLMKLLIKSNENLAERQRKHENELEQKREILMEKTREEEHLEHLDQQNLQINLTSLFLRRMKEINEQNREEEQSHQWTLEQYRQSIADQYRREDQYRQGEHDLNEFFDQTDLHNTAATILQRKILSLTRHLSRSQKTILIKNLYEEKVLHQECNSPPTSACRLDLKEADFSGIQLGSKDEENCPSGQYNGLSLPRMNLVNSSFDCLSLEHADFTRANLSVASFYRSRLYNASLDFANMNGCHLEETKMDELRVSELSIVGARSPRASLINARLLNVEGSGSDFRQANLAKSYWLEGILPNSKFDRANISGTTFNNGRMENASFYKAFGENSKFPMSDITNANFREAFLPQLEFVLTKGTGANFSNAILDGSNFRYTELDDCVFYNVSMNNTVFSDAKIRNANFRHALLSGSDFSGAELIGCDFSHANLRGAQEFTDEQLVTIFSISDAILPNGTRGENPSLVLYDHPICANTTMLMNRSEWRVSPPASVIMGNYTNTSTCVFQSTTSNVTKMSQTIDIRTFTKRMIDAGPTNILVKIGFLSGQIKVNLGLFDRNNDLVDQVFGLFDDTRNRHMSALHRITNRTIVHVKIEVFFLGIGTAIDNIHLSIEVESNLL